MNKAKNLAFRTLSVVTLFGLLLFFWSCTNSTPEVAPDTNVSEAKEAGDIIWHIKAIHPDGQTMDVKALDKDGNIFAIKAIQDTDQRHVLDIKALVGDKKLPVKILVSNDLYAPVKAIDEDGTIYDIKVLTADGDKLDVKGVKDSENIIAIKAINKNGDFYGIKAISSVGQFLDVKGVKMSKEHVEAVMNGVEIYAHIKTLPQTSYAGDHSIWHIKAIHPEGKMINVKALDKDGNIFDVKAIQESSQRQLMDIKAFVGEETLPVKILVSDDEYAPVKAIGEDGTIYDIKAITSDGDKLDVKGVNRSGNVIDIKAINKNGDFYGIKAISPEGQLNDVKGIKMSKEKLETVVNGVDVHAHIKALPPAN